jgi:RNA polymerase sigma-70 factor (ECF subfamily)
MEDNPRATTAAATALDPEVVAARGGNPAAFAAVTERYRAELQVHCYRLLGSLQDAEDLVQETFLRAWSKRASYQARSTFRAWLYGIATNACLDALRRRPKRVLPPDVGGPADPTKAPRPVTDLPWLEPFPDQLLEQAAANDDEPEARLLARETTELAFLAAIQHLPPRQRAILILRDVLDWSAGQTAASLETTVPSVNSALQRAHATLAKHLPSRMETRSPAAVSASEQALLEGLIEAWERADASALAALLREDARLVMPPTPSWFDGRDAIRTFFAEYAFAPGFQRRVRVLATRANRQPAMAVYVGERAGRPRKAFALVVLRVEHEAIAELTLFHSPELFAAWGLPAAV